MTGIERESSDVWGQSREKRRRGIFERGTIDVPAKCASKFDFKRWKSKDFNILSWNSLEAIYRLCEE